MLRDAQTRGAMTTPNEWWRHVKVVKIARLRGFKVPPPAAVKMDAEPAQAFVNWGTWVAECPNPNCLGGFEDVWISNPVFFCMKCGNVTANGLWIPVIVPANRSEIEAKLSLFTAPSMQNWELGETL